MNAERSVLLVGVRQVSLRGPILIVAAALAASLCWIVQFAFAADPDGGPRKVGLGNVLTSEDGGQIFGYAIDPSGEDGVLSTAVLSGPSHVSVETFDQNSGKITRMFATTGSGWLVDGIFSQDVGLITHYVVPSGSIYATRFYDVMNPVTAEKFTGKWTPPIKDIDVQQVGEDLTAGNDLLFAIKLKDNDNPVLLVSDVAANTFAKVIDLDPNLFSLAYSPNLGQYAFQNQAVMAISPDAGTVGGEAPLNVLIDLSTGKITQFQGYNNGPYHAGDVNGLAVDPNTGIAATDTELNAQVEFYDLAKKTGVGVAQLPCTSDVSQTQSGSGIAVDPVHKLFLVTETSYCTGTSGSAIVVYDETGHQKEVITGFNFPIGEGAPVLNPAKRMGWAFGGPKGFSQLQQFFY